MRMSERKSGAKKKLSFAHEIELLFDYTTKRIFMKIVWRVIMAIEVFLPLTRSLILFS